MTTGKKAASAAGKTLSNPKRTKGRKPPQRPIYRRQKKESKLQGAPMARPDFRLCDHEQTWRERSEFGNPRKSKHTMSTPAYVFLDANIALHFRSADEIDWLTLANAPEVVLVIAPIFIRELEKQKATNPSRKLRERAANTITWLTRLLEADGPIPIRKKVTLLFLDHEGQVDFKSERLSYEISDDHLLASALDFKNSTSGIIHIATADLGLRAKIRSRRLTGLVLPDELRLPAELDPVELENKELKRKVSSITARTPKLSVIFSTGDSRLIITPPNFDQIRIAEKISEIKAQHPKRKVGNDHMLFEQLMRNFDIPGRMTPDQIESRNLQLDRYYIEYEAFLEKMLSFKHAESLCFGLDLVLRNEGTSPANDVDVIMKFPNGLGLYDADELPNPPQEPEPPSQFPWTLGRNNAADFAPLYRSSAAPNCRGPYIRQDRNEIQFSVKALKHGFNEALRGSLIAFSDRSEMRSLQINVEISASELPTLQNEILSLIVEGG